MTRIERPTIARALTGVLFAAGLVGLSACGFGPNPDESTWRGEPHTILSDAEVSAEIDTKMDRVRRFLDERNLDGILLTQVRNVRWITGGLANNQIVLNKDVGVGSLLILRDGSKHLLSAPSESGRLMDETLADLGYEPHEFAWYEATPGRDVRADLIREIAGDGRIASDVPYPGTEMVSPEFESLRYALTDTEQKKYRWLGEQTTAAVQEVLRNVEPGMDEYEIEAMTARALRARGIKPTVLLIGVDERIHEYRHALPGGAELDRYAMVNVVTEKWGMSMAVTRFAHFGTPPAELRDKFRKTAEINARFQRATVPGTPAAEIFDRLQQWYDDAGVPGEWRKHHQGGAIGYDDREWIVYPGIDEQVHAGQAFAWNPTITGAKIEDTIVVSENGFEVVTRAGDWPMIEVELDGRTYEQPGVLIR